MSCTINIKQLLATKDYESSVQDENEVYLSNLATNLVKCLKLRIT